MKGRHIADSISLAHELIRNFDRPGDGKCCIKIDLRKAYDTVNRDFLCHLMRSMGFAEKWVRLVWECISTPTFSILVNGQPEGWMRSSRGLRQGDLLSPYLFTIVMEYLSCQLDVEEAKGRLKPLHPQIQPTISHLLFADDILLFSKVKVESILAIQEAMDNMGKWAGLVML